MSGGYLALVLHAHLPYIRHPEYEGYIEEKWLFEAVSESYIPLIEAFYRLEDENIDFRINMSLSPTLLSMLSDDLLKSRYIKYLEKLIELTEKEIGRTSEMHEFNILARMYNRKYHSDLEIFKDKYKCDLVGEFRKFQDHGKVEILACAATHGYLPLMTVSDEAVKAQISIGVKTYEKYFNRKPRGIWLPECGYVPLLDRHLKDNGIEYIITESHGVIFADPRPVFGTYMPIVSPKGIVAFGRDTESSKQVWSSTDGYPGDFDYRDFYRDIGYDLDFDYIKDYISPDGERIPTGIKYYRITGKTVEKQPYNPERAYSKAVMHSDNFVFNRQKQMEYFMKESGKHPIVVCPYDAELLGHWWYEGPYWLYSVCRKTYTGNDTFRLTTLSEYLDENPVMQVSTPCSSSWGHKGYNEMWLNRNNDWIYRHLHKAAENMVELANNYKFACGTTREALNQAVRELLLAQSSDWAFIMRAGTMVNYAEKRTKEHISRFFKLYNDIKESNIDEAWLEEIRNRDNIFSDIDYSLYSNV